MVQQLSDLPYAYGGSESVSDRRALSSHPDEYCQDCLNEFKEAEAKLREAQGNGDHAGMRALCDDLAHHYSRLLLDTISLANTHAAAVGLPTNAPADGLQKVLASWEAITQEFMSTAYLTRDSGWAVLAWQPNERQLAVLATEKRQSLAQWGVKPILALDVWKNAYYLHFLNSAASRTR